MFRLKVVTPRKIFYEEEVEMAIFRTTVGDRAIMDKHRPLVSGVKEGILKIKVEGQFREANIGNGFVTVDDKTYTTLITEKADWIK